MNQRTTLMAAIAAIAFALPATADEEPAAKPDSGPDPAAMFAELDTNKDGQLAGDEVPEEQKRLFERLVRIADKDKDGTLSGEEFAAGLAGGSNEPDAPRRPDRPPGDRRAGREGLARLFERMDSDSDGKVTLEEIPEARRERFGRLIERGDKDGDKALSKEEFAAAMPADGARPDGAKPPAGSPPKAPEGRPRGEQFFGRLDRNSDGKVTLDEAPEERKEFFEKLIERGDKDGDGALSKEELAGAMPGDGARPDRAKRPNRPGGRPEGRPDGAQFFKLMDKNSDGKVTLDELPEERQEFFKRVIERGDKDGDGALSAEEFSAMPRPDGRPGQPRGDSPDGRSAPGRGRPQIGLFQAVDADKDGKLSADEISAAAEMIRKLDADGDGSVTVEELVRAGSKPDSSE